MPPNNPSHRGSPVQPFNSCSASAVSSSALCGDTGEETQTRGEDIAYLRRSSAHATRAETFPLPGPQMLQSAIWSSACCGHWQGLLSVAKVSPGLRSRQQDCSQARFLGPNPRVTRVSQQSKFYQSRAGLSLT